MRQVERCFVFSHSQKVGNVMPLGKQILLALLRKKALSIQGVCHPGSATSSAAQGDKVCSATKIIANIMGQHPDIGTAAALNGNVKLSGTSLKCNQL